MEIILSLNYVLIEAVVMMHYPIEDAGSSSDYRDPTGQYDNAEQDYKGIIQYYVRSLMDGPIGDLQDDAHPRYELYNVQIIRNKMANLDLNARSRDEIESYVAEKIPTPIPR